MPMFQPSVSGGSGGPQSPQFYNWFRTPIAGKKLAIVGDSTSYMIGATPQIQAWIAANYTGNPGSPLYGVTLQYFGSNGNSLANFLNNYPSGYGLSDLIAAAPDGVILSYGINDARLQAGAPTLSALTGMLTSAVDQIRAALPNCDILLRMPNSALTTDVSGYGYVVPNSWAQGMTDLLRSAYLAMKGKYPNVQVWESQPRLFPEVCVASWPYMEDQIHPPISGYLKILEDCFRYFERQMVYLPGNGKYAQAAGYTDDYTRYPNVVLNGVDYDLITSGAFSSQGSGYIDFSGELSKLGAFKAGDVVVQNGQAAFALPLTFAQTLSGSNIRLQTLGAGKPTYVQTGGVVSVYRRKYAGISVPDISKYFAPSNHFQARLTVSASGSGYIRVANSGNDNRAQAMNISSADTMLHPTLGVVALAGASFSRFYDGVQINKGGTDFTMPSGAIEVFVVGSGLSRKECKTPPINFSQIGSLASVTLRQGCPLGGYYASLVASLGTAGSTATTVAVKTNGTTVLTLVFNASSTTPSTTTWASGGGFATTRPGDIVTCEITAGTGAADLVVSLDY